jgi:hypothetical protein
MKKFILIFLDILLNLSTLIGQQHSITSFSPIQGSTNETITIIGTNFTGVTNVKFGTTNASSFTIVSSTKITAIIGSGSTGSITITKTGFTNTTKIGFNYTTLPTITEITTNYSGYWNTNTTTPSIVLPDNTHELLAFKYKGQTFSTGINDGVLSGSFTPGDFRGLPVTLNGNTSVNSGNPQYIITSTLLDGSSTNAIVTHNNIKNLTIQSVLTDGTKGLDLSTGYTNLTANATSNYIVQFIDSTRIFDNEPDIIITQIADPTGTTTDTYKFLDINGNIVGNSLSVSLDLVARLGSYKLDLFTTPLSTSFSTAKPNGVNSSNTTRDIRFVAFRLSDFGINNSNFRNIAKLQIIASGKSDVAFVAYNANAIYSQPLITIDESTDSVFCAADTHLGFLINVIAPGETLNYQWQLSTNNGVSWSNISGETSLSLNLNNPFNLGWMYRLKVKVVTSGREYYSPTITLSGCLPVELLYFEGKTLDNYNILEWSTASENNSNYFEILHSMDGEQWDGIGKIPAAGNSISEIYYDYSVLIENFGVNYYRLIQFDFDGNYYIYNPIILNNTIPTKIIKKYINLLGQEVSYETKGMVFEVYEDGTSKKIIR